MLKFVNQPVRMRTMSPSSMPNTRIFRFIAALWSLHPEHIGSSLGSKTGSGR